MAILDAATGRHSWYEADHGVARDPLRDAIRNHWPVSMAGCNVMDIDLSIVLYGEHIGLPHNADGFMIVFEKKTHGAELKYSQRRQLELLDKVARADAAMARHWGGAWFLKEPPADQFQTAVFETHRPLTGETFSHRGLLSLLEWITNRARAQLVTGTPRALPNRPTVLRVPTTPRNVNDDWQYLNPKE